MIRKVRGRRRRGGEGFELVKATHAAIFQDVYQFAGTPRTTVLGKAEHAGLPPNFFLRPERIEIEGRRLFENLVLLCHKYHGIIRGTSQPGLMPWRKFRSVYGVCV